MCAGYVIYNDLVISVGSLIYNVVVMCAGYVIYNDLVISVGSLIYNVVGMCAGYVIYNDLVISNHLSIMWLLCQGTSSLRPCYFCRIIYL